MIKRKEISPLEMLLLIRKGARVKMQTFLHRMGFRRQVYRTRAYEKNVIYYCYHYAPLPIMVTGRGRVIPDQMAACFQNKFPSGLKP